MNLKEYYKQRLSNLLSEQLDEARRPKVEPIAGNTAPYGYHVKKSPSGRKRYIPKTKEEWEKETAEFHARNPGHWERVEKFQRENPLNLDKDTGGVDDHLPGGAKAALEQSRAAFGRIPKPKSRK